MDELEEEEPDQYLEEEFGSETKKLWKMVNDLKKKITKGKNIKTGEELDRMKFQRLIAEYKNFKRKHVQHFRFNSASNQTTLGITNGNSSKSSLMQPHSCYNVAGEEIQSTLELVQIYFDTATFDDIERDQKIKTEAQLSLIGGTMGLLTGFSIISGIEIIFFIFRLINFSNFTISNYLSLSLGWSAPSGSGGLMLWRSFRTI